MLSFPLYRMRDTELNVTMTACGQMVNLTGNSLLAYVAALLASEAARRDMNEKPAAVPIALPIGDSTGAEVVAAANFIASALRSMPDHQSAIAQFFNVLLDEIEAAMERIANATNN